VPALFFSVKFMVIDGSTSHAQQSWRIDSGDPGPLRRPIDSSPRWYEVGKHLLDFLIALVIGVVAAPVILIIGLLVKLSSRGPMLYTQTRVGRFGKPYTIYKLRTMRHCCEDLSGPQWSRPGDSRITFLGRILRKTHLDELPQLWNVLRGDMSLVGPRPERPEFVPELEKHIPGYRQRLLVRPGISGLAQVHLPPDTNIDSVRRKLAYDSYYIRHFSLWLDLRLISCTGLIFFGIPTSVSRRFLRLPGGVRVETVDSEAARLPTATPQLQPA
jgi:lipopolysaccharide/colanic/teichoic acid biosynthesis glycosyltransferase